MIDKHRFNLSRRAVLAGAALSFLTPSLARPAGGSEGQIKAFSLRAKPDRVGLLASSSAQTEVWAFNAHVPGPEIRVRQNDRVRITAENALMQTTTIHWHGIRVPNAMDGVPNLTQDPIPPGGRFLYEFDVPDAGTYWYHPHERSFEQVGRGLAGPLIVEETEPLAVDRDLVWVLDDWRLTPTGAMVDDFGNMMDVAMAGRIGNTVTVNGQVAGSDFLLRAGERLRLRLVNAANARIFALTFEGHAPHVIALDGQPVDPFPIRDELLVLAPGQRADIVLDASARPGDRLRVFDRFYAQQSYALVTFQYTQESPLRESPLDASIALPSNTFLRPNPAKAERAQIALSGGMMGMMGGGMMQGRGMGMMARSQGGVWAINGVSQTGHLSGPLMTLERGRSYIFEMINASVFAHPMHLHGHVFRVVSRNGVAITGDEWRDTVLVNSQERVEIAFVADNPGNWMFHCHILEHQAGGMMANIRVR